MDNDKIKNIIIIILVVLLIISIVLLGNKNKKISKIEEKQKVSDNISTSEEESGTTIEADEVEEKYDEATTKTSDYTYELVESRLAYSEKKLIENLKNEIKSTQDENIRSEKTEQLKNKYLEYNKKYIKKSEQNKIDTFNKKLENITPIYEEYDKIKWDIRENGSTTEKEQKLEELKKQLIELLNKLGDL